LFLKYFCDTAPFIAYIGRLDERERSVLCPQPLSNVSTVNKAKKDELLNM